MKWYIASRQKDRELTQRIINYLTSKEQEIGYDWTKVNNLTPYNENVEKSFYWMHTGNGFCGTGSGRQW